MFSSGAQRPALPTIAFSCQIRANPHPDPPSSLPPLSAHSLAPGAGKALCFRHRRSEGTERKLSLLHSQVYERTTLQAAPRESRQRSHSPSLSRDCSDLSQIPGERWGCRGGVGEGRGGLFLWP